jgi:hypothetical protein
LRHTYSDKGRSKSSNGTRYLVFLSKFQNKVRHKTKPGDAKAPADFKQRNLN